MSTFAQAPQTAQQSTSTKATIPRQALLGQSCGVNPMLRLQSMMGNQAVRQLLTVSSENGKGDGASTIETGGLHHGLKPMPQYAGTPVSIQPKLAVNVPGDGYEEEADQIAEQVMRMPEPRLQRACACRGGCSKCRTMQPDHEHERLQTKRVRGRDTGQVAAPPTVQEALAAPGHRHDPETQSFMEQRFGHDFSRVRVHSGAAAERSAQDVSAHAYTVGNDIVFGAGRFAPGTQAGRRLLAHELVHTLQQGVSPEPAGVVQRQASLDIALRSPGVAAQVLGSEILDGFALNSHILKGEHKRRLLALAQRLKQLLREHRLGTVEIIGHTDATGGEALNERLGQERADAVAAFLRGAEVSATALLVKSAGESALRIPTARPEPRNRRVEIRFLPEPAGPVVESAEPPKEPVRVPRPENLCTEHPEICDPITTKPEEMPSCRPANCSAYGKRFDQQPPDLRLLLTKSFKANAAAWFEGLDEERRLALQQIFNRMCQYGLLCQVRLIARVDSGEPPVAILDRQFQVPGRTPSVYFASLTVSSLPQTLIDTGRFCQATGIGASQHPNGPTLREISGSDSLHISVEGPDLIEAHVDRYSPVPKHPGSRYCPNDWTPAALGHIFRELVPEKARELLGIPGFEAFPEPGPPAPVPEGAVGPEPPRGSTGLSLGGIGRLLIGALLESSRITLRGPLAKPKQPLVPPEAKRASPDAGVLPTDVVQRIRHALAEQVSPEALLPSPARVRLTKAREAAEMAGPDEEAALRAVRDVAEREEAYTDAHDVAFDLAVRMEQARRRAEMWVKLDLDRYGRYGGLNGRSRRAILGEIRRIALILRNHMPERAAGVNTIVVIFGTGDLAVREEIRLPGWVERGKGLFE